MGREMLEQGVKRDNYTGQMTLSSPLSNTLRPANICVLQAMKQPFLVCFRPGESLLDLFHNIDLVQ
jgi:hypothetical protein